MEAEGGRGAGRGAGTVGGVKMRLPVYYYINLTTSEIKKYEITKEMYEKYLGGKILGAKLLMDLTPPKLDVFDEKTHVIINTTPMTDTTAPCTSRFNMTFKNVLTSGIGSSNCGGPFGFMLKRAGIDGLIITGKASEPTTISVVDGEITLLDASDLWGMDTERAQEMFPEHYGKFVIGVAGENLVKYACAVSGERVAGRCGSGAVLGAKNIKALVAYGTKRPEIHNREGFDKYIKKWTKFLQNHHTTGDALPSFGSAGLVSKTNVKRVLPTRNFQDGKFDEFEKISGQHLAEKYLTRNGSCISCPIRCERRVKVKGKEVKGPEFETVGLFGSNLDIADLELTNELNYYADLLGMDTISLGGVLAFAMELKEKGLADFDLEFGKKDNLMEVINKIAIREGKYSELADGVKCLSQKYGGSEFAIHSKGLELASYEPRSSVGMGLGYATSNRGGCHLNGGYLALLESVGVLNMDNHTPNGKPELVVLLQNAVEAVSGTGFCLFSVQSMVPNILFKFGPTSKINTIIPKVTLSAKYFTGKLVKNSSKLLKLNSMLLFPHSKAIALATGIKMDSAKFLMLGERGYNIERLYNLREGLSMEDDSLPSRLTKELQIKDNPASVVNLDAMLPVYYSCRNWDENGVPTSKILERLDI